MRTVRSYKRRGRLAVNCVTPYSAIVLKCFAIRRKTFRQINAHCAFGYGLKKFAERGVLHG